MNRTYDDATKAQVIAALLEGQSVSAIAREYEIPRGTVQAWKQRKSNPVAANAARKKESADGETVGDLLMTLLTTNIRGLIKISETTMDEAWIKRQDAAELATFFGVKHDKAIRMIEAMNKSDDAP